MTPEEAAQELQKVELVLKEFYVERAKQMMPDPIKSFKITGILRRESAVMHVRVEETMEDGTTRSNSRYLHKKNGAWIEG
ncbi:hypothetical protein GC098_30130 [Paenibacillus sp. LMG 31458]|uniref:Uncharacterized protein n=1 Tax=Paenibacillus phytorum TaxID=2654977 RepID=A0ABX1Y3V6_9BACL|nr:hypothetical protein [Paenibacillus phytorum]NOU75585.1 hypothetical protein [Paenibacillus phytorum]